MSRLNSHEFNKLRYSRQCFLENAHVHLNCYSQHRNIKIIIGDRCLNYLTELGQFQVHILCNQQNVRNYIHHAKTNFLSHSPNYLNLLCPYQDDDDTLFN